MELVFSLFTLINPKLIRRCSVIVLVTFLTLTNVVKAESQATERVVLQLKWSHQFQFAGYYMAKHLGYYSDQGIDLEIRPGTPTLDVTQEVLSGNADFGVGTSSLLLDYAAGKPVVVLGVIYQHSPLVLITRTQRSSDTIETVAQGPLMIEAHSGDLMAMLRRAGLASENLNIIARPDNALDILEKSQNVSSISAYQTDEPYTLLEDGIEFNTFSPRTYGVDFYGDNFFTARQTLDERKEMVQAFRQATIRGWQEALRDPETAINLILEEYPTGNNREKLRYEARVTQDLMTNLVRPGHMNPERWNHISDTFLETGMLSKKPDLSGFIFDEQPKQLPKWFWPVLLSVLTVVLILAVISFYFRSLNVRLKEEVALRLDAEKHLQTTNSKLNEAKQIAEEANLKKTWFITNVSHDLKAPVSAMISLSQIFNHHSQSLNLPDKFNRFLRQLNSGGEFLMLMLHNILDHSALEMNAVSVHPETLNLEECCTSMVNLVQALADEKEVSIDVSWQGDHRTLEMDRARVSQILLNLLHNAIKFSPERGTVTLALSIQPESLKFTVSDHGPGISPDKQRELFKMFGQSERSVTGHTSTGLGLSIVKRNVELLGGSIEVSPAQPSGAVFSIAVPLNSLPEMASR